MFRSQYQCELYHFACTIYLNIYIIHILKLSIWNIVYMKYIMYNIWYINSRIPCDLHKALHTGPFARILASEWPVCMHRCRRGKSTVRVCSLREMAFRKLHHHTPLCPQRKVDSLICYANGQLSISLDVWLEPLRSSRWQCNRRRIPDLKMVPLAYDVCNIEIHRYYNVVLLAGLLIIIN